MSSPLVEAALLGDEHARASFASLQALDDGHSLAFHFLLQRRQEVTGARTQLPATGRAPGAKQV